jgi:hypothetical protein
VSHHFDSAADRADGRINLCDLYAFLGPPGTSALILTVNPDAGAIRKADSRRPDGHGWAREGAGDRSAAPAAEPSPSRAPAFAVRR